MNKSKQARPTHSDLHFYSSLQFDQALNVLNDLSRSYPGVRVFQPENDRCKFDIRSTRVRAKGSLRRWNGTQSELACQISFPRDWLYFAGWMAFLLVSGFLTLVFLLSIPRLLSAFGLFVFVIMAMFFVWFGGSMFVVFFRLWGYSRHAEKEKDALRQHIVQAFRAAGQVAYHGALLVDAPLDRLTLDEPPKLKQDGE